MLYGNVYSIARSNELESFEKLEVGLQISLKYCVVIHFRDLDVELLMHLLLFVCCQLSMSIFNMYVPNIGLDQSTIALQMYF